MCIIWRIVDDNSFVKPAAVIGRRILRFEQVTSTNDLVRQLAERGEAEGLVVTAEEQTSGRGRLGRRWIAPPRTSLQLSILLRPPLAPHQALSLTPMAALAVSRSLRDEFDLAPCLKWPNDVLVNEKKCAGILLETSIVGDALAFAILGVGINVNFSMRAEAPELAPFATTLADELHQDVDRAVLERALLASLDDYYARLCAGENFLEEWRAQMSTLGRNVRVQTPWGIEEGVAEDVDADGALFLRRGEEIVKLYAGAVTVLKDES